MRMRIQSKDGNRAININCRKAIRENYLNCSNWNTAEVQNCQHSDCPLYPYRLGKGPQKPKDRAKAIRAYCLWCMNGRPSEATKCVTRNCPLFPYRQAKVDTTVEISLTGSRKAHIELSPEPKMVGAVG